MGESSLRTPKRLPKSERLHQVLRWLISEFEVKARLRVEKLPKGNEGCLGVVEFGGKLPPLIRISKNMSRSESLSVLFHEYAHCLSHKKHGPHWHREYQGHDKDFAILYNKIETSFLYEDGAKKSLEY